MDQERQPLNELGGTQAISEVDDDDNDDEPTLRWNNDERKQAGITSSTTMCLQWPTQPPY